MEKRFKELNWTTTRLLSSKSETKTRFRGVSDSWPVTRKWVTPLSDVSFYYTSWGELLYEDDTLPFPSEIFSHSPGVSEATAAFIHDCVYRSSLFLAYRKLYVEWGRVDLI